MAKNEFLGYLHEGDFRQLATNDNCHNCSQIENTNG